MAVKDWFSLKRNSSTTQATIDNPAFLAWAQDVDAALLEIGLVRETVSAAVQADLTVATCPAANATTVFKIYELNDAFSATLPIYIKVAYGGVSASTVAPTIAAVAQCFVQIGTTVDAAGNIGGLDSGMFVNLSNHISNPGISFTATTTSQNYLSKSDGSLVVIIGGSIVNNAIGRPVMSFVLERVPDKNGSITADGYTVLRCTQSIAVSNGVTPTAALTRTLTTTNNPGTWYSNTSAIIGSSLAASADGAVQFQRFYHVTPEILPMRSLMAYFSDSIVPKSTIVVSASGAVRRYLGMSGTPAVNNYGFLVDATDTSYNAAILWG